MGNDLSYAKRKTLKIEENAYILNANFSYIIAYNGKGLYIQYLDSNNPISFKVENSRKINSVIFHPKYNNIFLSFSIYSSEIKIWEIIKSKKICKERITIKGHNKPNKIVLFSKSDDKRLASYSEDNTIKIWSMNNSFCVTSISVNKEIKNIEYIHDLFYQEGNECIVVYDTIKLIEKSRIKINVGKFFVFTKEPYDRKNSYEFIIFEGNMLIHYPDSKKKLKFNNECLNIFYDDNLKIIFLFLNKYLKIIKAKSFEEILTVDNQYYDTIYINNQKNDKNICGNFLYLRNPSEIYSFYSKEIYNDNKINALTNVSEEFWEKSFPLISYVQNLSWNNNINMPEEDFLKKNYLKDIEIENEIYSNYAISLKKKRLDVEEKIKIFNEEENININYKKYLMLLIKDNTNKKLIIKYLTYLKKYGTKITVKFIEQFNNEFDYYKVMFENKELINNEFDKKEYSEKESFFELLNDIIKIDIKNYNNDDNYKKIKKKFKKIQTFNQPIKFDNKELYWHRNCFVVYYSLKKIIEEELVKEGEKNRFEMFDMMKQCINKIINRGLFQKDYILNNKELLTSLISLIALPQNNEYCDFNLNLIESKNPEKNIDNKLEQYKNILFKDNNIYHYKNNYKYILDLNDIKYTCIDNFILRANQGTIKLDDEEIKNYDEIDKYFKQIIDIQKVNKFLSKIFCSNVIKEAFKILYPEYYLFPFDNDEEAFTFIQENFHYIPFKSSRAGAITEKFTLESYFFLQKRKIFFNEINLKKEQINLINRIFYNSNAVKTNSHEMNHNFYNILFLHSNGLNTVRTPRKNNIEQSESGKNLERLLFNRCLYRMNLAECLYILNEKNYSKTLDEFREGFNEINVNDLKIDKEGIFYEFNEFFKIKDYNLLLNGAIMVSSDSDDHYNNFLKDSFIDNIGDENDVLGFFEFY